MRLSRGTPGGLHRELLRLRQAPLTYRPVGVTLQENRVAAGHSVVLGQGEATYQRARAALMGWTTHRTHWLGLVPTDVPPTEGHTVLVVLKVLGLCLSFGCRVVRVLDEPRRSGFAYGSLPGHPECGEELFLVEWHPDDRVSFSLRAVSRPANLVYALGRPFGTFVRGLGTRQYLTSMQAAMPERMRR